MEPFLSDSFYNPSATYAPARLVMESLEAARAKVAYWLGARPAEVVFTAGGTEANNLAIHGIMQLLSERFPGTALNVVVSSVEHDAILRPAEQYHHTVARVTADGVIDLKDLQSVIDDNTVLVSVMYANNELGTVQPIKKITQHVKHIREQRRQAGNSLPLYVHTDACQAANYLDLHVARLGVDLMTLNGGKMYGPKQSGILYVKAGLELSPLMHGGGQEQGLRSGTENVAACVGLATALDIAQTERQYETARLQILQRQLIKALAVKLPAITINGSLKKRLPNNVHASFSFQPQDNERLLLQLEARGILAAAGSACSAGSGEPSHVLRAIGLSDAEAQSSIRFSMGRATNEAAIDKLVKTLQTILG